MIDEPVWVRDTQAAPMELRIPEGGDFNAVLADIFKGEIYHCDMCGAASPVWPPRELGAHAVAQHSDELTVQGLASASMLCLPEIGPAHRVFLAAQLMTRVAPRRRARELGLWHPSGSINPARCPAVTIWQILIITPRAMWILAHDPHWWRSVGVWAAIAVEGFRIGLAGTRISESSQWN